MELKQCVPSEMSPPLNPHLIKDVAGLELVTKFLSSTTDFCLDLETNVTDHFFDRRIRTIQVGNRYEQYVIDLLAFAGSTTQLLEGMGGHCPSQWAKPVLDCLRPFLESDKSLKVGQALDFEYETLSWNLGLRIFHLYDTLLAEKVIHAGNVHYFARNFWGLEDLTGRYCGLKIGKEEQKVFNLTDELTHEQVVYAALDVRLPLAIKSGQNLLITKTKLEKAVQIENDAIPAFGDMHIAGLLIDTDAWRAELGRVNILHQQNLDKLDELFIPVVGPAVEPYPQEAIDAAEAVWRDEKDKSVRPALRSRFYELRKATGEWRKKALKFEGRANVRYGSPDQLLKALRKAGYGPDRLKSTSDDFLELMEGEPLIDAIREYRTTYQILKTMGEAYLDEHIDKRTGRVHSRFSQLGAATGRTSSSSPNVQNINKKSAWRQCFVARPGYSIITIDYNGCELRILAEASGEKVWIDAFNAGWDVHSVGAEIVFGERWKVAAEPGCAYYASHQKCKCKLHKILRDQIKAINFGIAYGMEAKKLSRQIHVTLAEAKMLLAAWRDAFKAVVAYLEKSGNEAKINLCSRTLSGRIRYYTKPDWNKAKEIALERAEEDGLAINERSVARAYKGMFGSIEREGKNAPIQGSNADALKLAMGSGIGYIWRTLWPQFGGYIVNMVHDELVLEVPSEVAQECLEFASACMRKAGAEFVKTVVLEVEGCIADRWSK